MTEHTGGPWRVEERDGELFIIGRPEWKCTRHGIEGEWEVCMLDNWGGSELEALANARLIANSPEFLKAAWGYYG